jgi:hypothetical protein
MPNVTSYVKHNYLLKHDDSWTSFDSIENSLTYSTVESAKNLHILSQYFGFGCEFRYDPTMPSRRQFTVSAVATAGLGGIARSARATSAPM